MPRRWYCFRDKRYLEDEEAKACQDKEFLYGEKCWKLVSIICEQKEGVG